MTAVAMLAMGMNAPLASEQEAAHGTDADEPLLLQRIEQQKDAAEERFAILAHQPTWIMPVTWHFSPHQEPWTGTEREVDSIEAVFQISLKVPMLWNLWSDEASLWAGYTQRAWWQAYNGDDSRPFRETNHEPEIFVDLLTDWTYLGLEQRLLRVGISHLSNGQSEPQSRSLNRVYVAFVYEFGDVAVALRPWYRLRESAEESDNPDIDDYLGTFDTIAIWKNGDNEYSLTLRNNLDRSENRGAVQLDWSFPLHGNVRGYVQVFNGYGESLIDYNDSVTRIGAGVLLSGWL